MFNMKTISLALGLAVSSSLWMSAFAQDAQRNVVVLPFANACVSSESAPAHPELLDQLAKAVVQQLSTQAHVYEHVEDAPVGALIVAGCIRRADPGDPAERLIGMNMGASVLSAHIQIYRNDQPASQAVREFDVEVTGANKLPPIGPIGLMIHGVKSLHQTLDADAAKLAKLIAVQVIDA